MGAIATYPLDPNAKRKVWRFLLPELVATIALASGLIGKMRKLCDPAGGSPR
jgi:hypothetical protein